jgi:hypothetical protein
MRLKLRSLAEKPHNRQFQQSQLFPASSIDTAHRRSHTIQLYLLHEAIPLRQT